MDNSPLGKLPAELRNDIYKLVLEAKKPLVIFCSRLPNLRTATQPALTRVCRQIRSETVKMFYHSNAFVAEIQASGEDFWSSQDGVIDKVDQIEKWYNCMSLENYAAIRNLQLAIVSGSWCLHKDIEEEFKYLVQTLKRLGLVRKKGEAGKMQVIAWLLAAEDDDDYLVSPIKRSIELVFEQWGLKVRVIWEDLDGTLK